MKFCLILLYSLISISAIAQVCVIDGVVKERISNEPIPFARVFVQGTEKGAITDEQGKFSVSALEPGVYNIEVTCLGFSKAIVFEVEVTTDRAAFVEFLLEAIKTELGEVEIKTSSISNQEESPISIRTIGMNEIKRNPGGGRDISKVIRTLPGVAAIPSFRNDIIIRGGAASENRFYIDGIEIPNINHFATQGASGGPVGLINVDLIEDVEFYSGAFPAARGNALSSVLEFGFRDARRDKYTANFVVGSSDLGITVEGPTGENSGLILSVRRSYLQALFALLELPFLPTYNDYNLKWNWDINEKNKLTIISLGALDDFALNLKLDDDTSNENFARNRYLLENLVTNQQWNYSLGVKWENYRENSKWTLVASRNMLSNAAFKFLMNDESQPRTFDYESTEQENKLRIEHKIYSAKGWKVMYGVGYEFSGYDNRSDFADYNPASDSTVSVKYSTAFTLNKYRAFAQASRDLIKNRLILSAGLSSDGNDFSNEMRNPLSQLSPRLAMRYAISPEWTINTSAGIYYQIPSYISLGFQRNGKFLNADSKYIRNSQLVAGMQYDWDKRNSIFSLEGFYKYYEHYPVSVDKGISLANLGADFGTVGNEDLLSSGFGRAFGAEFLFQQKLYKGFYGVLAYTFVRSEFTGLNNEWVASSWDSRHLISLTGGKKFKRNWELGAVFRLSGGLPYTPDNVSASMYKPTWDAIHIAQPDWSQLNSMRIETFHQLDVRLDKKWFFSRWSLDVFLDIQNIYNSVTPLKPTLDVLRDSSGIPVSDETNPDYYKPNFLDNSTSSILPTIGIVVEL